MVYDVVPIPVIALSTVIAVRPIPITVAPAPILIVLLPVTGTKSPSAISFDASPFRFSVVIPVIVISFRRSVAPSVEPILVVVGTVVEDAALNPNSS